MKQIIRYSDEDLKIFEELLLSKKSKMLEHIESCKIQLKELAENGKDENSMDNTSFESQINYLVSFKERSENHLSDIEKALYKIRTKSYGICIVTGKLIDKKRLMAVPTTTKSIEAKTKSF